VGDGRLLRRFGRAVGASSKQHPHPRRRRQLGYRLRQTRVRTVDSHCALRSAHPAPRPNAHKHRPPQKGVGLLHWKHPSDCAKADVQKRMCKSRCAKADVLDSPTYAPICLSFAPFPTLCVRFGMFRPLVRLPASGYPGVYTRVSDYTSWMCSYVSTRGCTEAQYESQMRLSPDELANASHTNWTDTLLVPGSLYERGGPTPHSIVGGDIFVDVPRSGVAAPFGPTPPTAFSFNQSGRIINGVRTVDSNCANPDTLRCSRTHAPLAHKHPTRTSTGHRKGAWVSFTGSTLPTVWETLKRACAPGNHYGCRVGGYTVLNPSGKGEIPCECLQKRVCL
jgi:hypothetical protein